MLYMNKKINLITFYAQKQAINTFLNQIWQKWYAFLSDSIPPQRTVAENEAGFVTKIF